MIKTPPNLGVVFFLKRNSSQICKTPSNLGLALSYFGIRFTECCLFVVVAKTKPTPPELRPDQIGQAKFIFLTRSHARKAV